MATDDRETAAVLKQSYEEASRAVANTDEEFSVDALFSCMSKLLTARATTAPASGVALAEELNAKRVADVELAGVTLIPDELVQRIYTFLAASPKVQGSEVGLATIAIALSEFDNGRLTAFGAHTRIGNALSRVGMTWNRDKKLYEFAASRTGQKGADT